MAYRRFDTGTWDDPWFESLSVKAKLLFIFLFTNNICNQAGLYEISTKKIKANLDFDPTDVFQELQPKVAYYPKHNIVWVKNFLRWQCQNESFLKGAVNSLPHTDSTILREFYRYNKDLFEKYNVEIKIPESQHCVDTVLAQCQDSEPTVPSSEQNRTDTEADNIYIHQSPDGDVMSHPHQKHQNQHQKNHNGNSYSKDFLEFWECYPRKVGKRAAFKAWKRLKSELPPLDALIDAINRQRASPQWREGYIPHPSTWLNQGRWEDEDIQEVSDDPFRLVREKYGKAE